MNNALAHRDELAITTASYDRQIAEIRDDVIHSIVHTVMGLNKRGYSFTIGFEADHLTVCRFDQSQKCEYIKSGDEICLSTAAHLIDALDQLEQLDKEKFIDDALMLFSKEGNEDAEDVQ